jgi:hypothetical protein
MVLMRKVVLLAVCLVSGLWSQTSAPDILREGVLIAVEAARSDTPEAYAAASRYLAPAVKVTRDGGSSGRPDELGVLLFWCNILGDSISPPPPAGAPPPGEQPPPAIEPAAPDDPLTQEILPPFPVAPDTAALDQLRAVMEGIAADYNKDSAGGRARLDEYLRGAEGASAPARDFLLSFLAGLAGALEHLDGELARLAGQVVQFQTGRDPRVHMGTVLMVSDGTVKILCGETQLGIPVFNLSRGYVQIAAAPLDPQERLFIGLHLCLAGRDDLAPFVTGPAAAENETYRTVTGLLVQSRRAHALADNMRTIDAAMHRFGSGEYVPALALVMRLNALDDTTLVFLDGQTRLQYGLSIPQLLTLVMTTCRSCGGAFRVECDECRGLGKKVDDSSDPLFLKDKQTLRFVTCRKCGGDGILQCPTCFSRRSDPAARAFADRLNSLFSGQEQGEERHDRPTEAHQE